MSVNIKQLNETFNAKQQMIEKNNAKLYSKAVNLVSAENLNNIAYRDVMIIIMDEIIKYQKKKLPMEEIFGGNIEEYVKNLCKNRPKKKVEETVLEALGVMGWVFFAGFLAGAIMVGPKMQLSALAIIRWSTLMIVGILAILYFQRKNMKSQTTVMLIIVMIYMSASNMIDIIFKNFTDFAIPVNTYILTILFLAMGFGGTKMKTIIRDREYEKWKHKK